jgi:hypothetical protein
MAIILKTILLREPKLRILCGTFSFGVELESGIGDLRILCGTLLFVSRFSTLSSQSDPKTQLRALGVRYIREFYALGQRTKISSEIYSC